jgi:serine/threonine protein kinase
MSSNKRSKPNPDEEIFTELSEQLKTKYGSCFGNVVFLMLLQRLYLCEKSLEECAQFILESVRDGCYSHLLQLYISVGAFKLRNVDERQFLVPIFVMLMNTYVHYVIEHKKSGKLRCVFRDKEWDVHIIGSKIENGNCIFFSEMFEIMLVNDGETIRYVATLRKEIRLHESEVGKISFVPSDDTSHPPIILGGGSYGFAFKILDVDGSWCVVKVFGKKEDAEHEWSALTLIKGKHQSFQEGIALQTEREGDVQHIIVSCFQGDIVLSKVRDSIYLLNLQQIIWMFLELAKGIKSLHEHGILHCDIKPDNLIISQDPQGRLVLTLIDFGIASRIGSTTDDPQSYYTWWYRSPSLFLGDFMKSFNTMLSTFVEPVKLSPVMDWWAFFITFLHAVSEKSTDFLGFRSKTEEEAYQHMIRTSCVAQLMKKMKPWLGGDNRSVDFVRRIYFVLLNKEGPEKFVESFNTVGIKLTGTGVYDEYLNMFNRLRDNHPMIAHVRNVFKHVKCKDKKIDISGPMKNLTELFIDILRDGADLSLLDCLTMDHIERWLDRLNESLLELCKLGSRILFY